jgi:cytochrome P450
MSEVLHEMTERISTTPPSTVGGSQSSERGLTPTPQPVLPSVTDVRRPPGPPPNPMHGVAARRNLFKHLQYVATFGDLVYFHRGRVGMYLANHPDYVKELLVTNSRSWANLRQPGPAMGNGLLSSDGEFHHRQRRLIRPAFHHGRIGAYADIMVGHASSVRERWRDGENLDIHHEMWGLALSNVVQSLFDTDIDQEERRELRTAWYRLSEVLGEGFGTGLEARGRTDEKQAQTFGGLLQIIDGFIYEMIERHRARGDGQDILSMLVAAQDDPEDGAGMTDQQIRDEAFTMIQAGHETVANGMSWALYLVAEHPDVEAKLLEELDRVLAGRLPTMSDIPELQFTRSIFAEAMRLYPPIPVSGRRAIEDNELAGYTIPAGTTVLMSEYLIHRDPRWWQEPDAFDPDRWTPEAEARRPRFAYFPFGGGSRLCIGEPFAWMEGVLVLATVLQRWHMEVVPEQRIKAHPRISLTPQGGMRVHVFART